MYILPIDWKYYRMPGWRAWLWIDKVVSYFDFWATSMRLAYLLLTLTICQAKDEAWVGHMQGKGPTYYVIALATGVLKWVKFSNWDRNKTNRERMGPKLTSLNPWWTSFQSKWQKPEQTLHRNPSLKVPTQNQIAESCAFEKSLVSQRQRVAAGERFLRHGTLCWEWALISYLIYCLAI